MPEHAKLQTAAAILCGTLLTACPGDRPELILPPAELAICANEPAPLALPEMPPLVTAEHIPAFLTAFTKRGEMVTEYIFGDGQGKPGLRGAWGDCKAKVEGLARWREEAAD